MARLLSSVLSLILFMMLSGVTGFAAPIESDLEEEEYVIYSAFITALLEAERLPAPVEPIVINDRTTPIKEPHYLSGMSLKDTYESYKAKNERSHVLERRFGLKVKYEFVSSNEDIVSLMTKHATWYPRGRGCLLFSRVGLNRERTEALFYVEVYRTISGRADGILLRKEGGAWKVKRSRRLWIA